MGIETAKSVAISGSRRAITNSVVPIANVPTASAPIAAVDRSITTPPVQTNANRFTGRAGGTGAGPDRPCAGVV